MTCPMRNYPPIMRYGRDIRDRFAEYVDERGPDECWPWLGGRNAKGYGAFGLVGIGTPRKRKWGAHIIALMLTGVNAPRGSDVHHDCENPGCVNPAHLRVLTPSEHARLRRSKTHCKRGHDLQVYAYRRASGHRDCRECDRLRKRASRAARAR